MPRNVLIGQPNAQAANAWVANARNRAQIPADVRADIAARGAPAAQEFIRLQRALMLQYDAELAAYNQQQGLPPPEQAPVAPPVAPQQPAAPQEAGLSRAEINLIRELEGNRLAVAAAQQALAAAPQNRQRREALDTAQRKFRRAEERAIRSGVANVAYDPTMGAPKPPRVGDGMYGGVSAEMAGMDDEYLDMDLHDGFVDRGNWSGMMKALGQMPTAPFGAGIPYEEGEEMPIGVSGSSHRIGGMYEDGDLLSSDEEPEEESEEDDMYDREMAGRGQLDDAAERIQANRTKSELNIAKGGAKNMKEMLAKLKSKIKCY
jgi:hypothetical protein